MTTSDWSSKKDIPITPPTENILASVNNVKGKAAWMPAQRLILHSKKDSKPDLWEVNFKHETVTITFGTNKLIDFKNSIKRVKQKEGDFAIADADSKNILYFWSI
jgi:hypothetical protein